MNTNNSILPQDARKGVFDPSLAMPGRVLFFPVGGVHVKNFGPWMAS